MGTQEHLEQSMWNCGTRWDRSYEQICQTVVTTVMSKYRSGSYEQTASKWRNNDREETAWIHQ